MSGYRGGHILRIKIQNFMTYDEMELFPKPGLNLVIGLNGSGKSSIMCAICLGLAGKPQYTGRSSQLSDFIKYGCDKAIVEIELEQIGKRNVIITRIIQNDKSSWMLNKTAVPLGEIQNTVKKFNIDVSNLCQFLPQEKVTEFSKMDKKQRLENMLQAIGEPKLFTLFKELKELKAKSLKLETQKKGFLNIKEEDDNHNKRLKIDVERHEQRLRDKESLNSLKQYRMVLQYNEIRSKIRELTEEIKPLKNHIKKLEEEVTALAKKKEERIIVFKQIIEEIRVQKRKSRDIQDKLAKYVQELADLDEKISRVKIHYRNRLEEKQNQEANLSKLAQQIKGLEDVCEGNSLKRPDFKRKNDQLTSELERIKGDLNSLQSQQVYANLEKNKLESNIKMIKRKVDEMKSEENKKMELLKQRFKDVYEAVVWLQENENRFKSKVYPPMLLLLKVREDDNRKFIENLVAQRDLIAFLCEDKEDNKLLTNILRLKKNLQVSIVMVPSTDLNNYLSPNLNTELRKLGIRCFLKDIVDAPEAVMCYLCHCYKLHLIPLCVPAAENKMDVILRQYKTFFTPEAKISGKTSKYGARNLCIRKDPIKSRNFLPSSSEQSEEFQSIMRQYQIQNKELEATISKLRNLDEEIQNLEKNEHKLRVEKRELTDALKNFDNTEKLLEQKRLSYNRKKSELIDEKREEFTLNTSVRGINAQKISIFETLKDLLEKFIILKTKRLEENIQARRLFTGLEAVELMLSEKSNELDDIKNQNNERCQYRLQLLEQGKALKVKIDEAYPESNDVERKIRTKKFGNITESNEMTDLENLPSSLLEHFPKRLLEAIKDLTLEDIDKEICKIEAMLELNGEDNDEVVHEYRKREKKIRETEKEIEKVDKELMNIQNTMLQKKAEWLPPLQTHIKNINSKFSSYYKQLKCAGEISLDTCNNSDDFPKYGLQITLKYRDSEPFMELSNTHHSGGECSVAAIIFILSLQELTEVPFRCIDEINQGMDSQNERNIYHLIADNAKSGSCSQYFLLTPKLLMDLEMIQHRDVAVHVIYNSCFLEMKMDVEKHIELAGNK